MKYLVALLSIFWLNATSHAAGPLALGTTTTLRDSGLLEYLQADFYETHGIAIRSIVLSSGQVFSAAKRGDIDIALTHAPKAEQAFINSGLGLARTPVFYNHFLLVGPANPSLKLADKGSLADALQSVHKQKLAFISRDDDSGTQAFEQKLLSQLGIEPTGKHYIKSGRGMGPTLQLANQLQAYTLCDWATWQAYQAKLSLQPIVNRPQAKQNQYSLVTVNPNHSSHPPQASAELFYRWLTGPAGQAAVETFQLNGQQLFHAGMAKSEN